MVNPSDYDDTTLVETLRSTAAPRILTTRKDGEVVYVALDDAGNLTEVAVS